MLLRLDNVEKNVGARCLFRGVNLEVRSGDRIGLIGPNGAGKSTLLRIAAGDETPDRGSRVLPKHSRVGFLRQEIDPARDRSVRDEVSSALEEIHRIEAELQELQSSMAALGSDVPAATAERYDVLHTRFELLGGFQREARVERILAGLGFAEEARERPLSGFSGGWLMRVELAKLLLAAPEVLLLDEPTNHLDLPSIEWFEATLSSYKGAAIVISHDRTFLRRHVSRVAELDAARFTVYDRDFDGYLAERALRQEQLLAAKANQDRKIAQTEQFIGRFRYKASKARQVQSRIKGLEKIARVEVDADRARAPRLRLPPVVRAGRVVLRLEALHKRYHENRVFEGIDFQLERGERVALAGPNGAGKSTLLRLSAGVLPFEAGTREPGHNVTCAYYAQHQLEALNTHNTVLEELASAATTDDQPRLRSHLGAFLFSGDDVKKKVSVLSGGEKARLALARLLLRPANLLVMDEPTNHLDLAAREALETALAGFGGTLLVVSHDRSFINALATRVVEVRAGQLRSFPGNYDEYLRKTAASSDTPEVPAGDTPVEHRDRPTKAVARRQRAQEREARKVRTRIQREITRLERQIQEREEAYEALTERLLDPETYRDGDLMRELESSRSTLRETIAAETREWEQCVARLEDV